MDLLNATGEKIVGMYDGRAYVFEPGELVQVVESAGRHLIKKLRRFGLQAVRYDDDPEEISFNAIQAIMVHHQRMLDEHNDLVESQKHKNFPIPDESEAVLKAKRAIKVYGKRWEQMRQAREERDDEAYAAQVEANLNKTIQLPDLATLDLEQLRETLGTLGGEGNIERMNRRTLIARITAKARDMNVEIGKEDVPDV